MYKNNELLSSIFYFLFQNKIKRKQVYNHIWGTVSLKVKNERTVKNQIYQEEFNVFQGQWQTPSKFKGMTSISMHILREENYRATALREHVSSRWISGRFARKPSEIWLTTTDIKQIQIVQRAYKRVALSDGYTNHLFIYESRRDGGSRMWKKIKPLNKTYPSINLRGLITIYTVVCCDSPHIRFELVESQLSRSSIGFIV